MVRFKSGGLRVLCQSGVGLAYVVTRQVAAITARWPHGTRILRAAARPDVGRRQADRAALGAPTAGEPRHRPVSAAEPFGSSRSFMAPLPVKSLAGRA